MRELAATRRHLATLHIGLFGIILALFFGAHFMLVRTQAAQDKALAAANAQNAQFIQTMKDTQTQWLASEQTRQQNAAKVEVITREIQTRDTTADAAIKQVTQPDATLQQVAQDSETYLNAKPILKLDVNALAFTPSQVQGFIATKIDRDRLDGDLKSTQAEVALHKQNEATYQADLTAAKVSLDSCQKTVTGYEKAAKRGKWRKFFDNAEKAAIFAGGLYIGKVV